jgi:hypothetical protein
MLHHAGIGQFKLLKDTPTFRELPLAIVPTAVDQMTWSEGIGHGFGHNSSLTFTLDVPQLIYAIRLKYSYGPTAVNPAFFRMAWKNTGRNDFDTAERNIHLKLQHWQTYAPTGPGEKTLTIWVNETIDQFRIQPDTKPCDFRLAEIVVLVPSAERHASPGPRNNAS